MISEVKDSFMTFNPFQGKVFIRKEEGIHHRFLIIQGMHIIMDIGFAKNGLIHTNKIF